MEAQRQKLHAAEAEHYATEKLLDSGTFASVAEEEELQRRLQRQQEHIENQRKIFEDLEFQQLEVRH